MRHPRWSSSAPIRMTSGGGIASLAAMSRLELLPFDEGHLPDAGRLLAERHRRHRLAEPLLPGPLRGPCDLPRPRWPPSSRPTRPPERWRSATAGSSATCSAPRSAGRAGAPNVWVETAGHGGRGGRGRPRPVRRGGRPGGSTRAAPRTTPSCPRTTTRWSAPGSASRSGTSTRTPSATTLDRRAADAAAGRGSAAPSAPTSRPWPGSRSSSRATRAWRRRSPPATRAPTRSRWRSGTEDFDDPDYTTFVAEYDGRVIGSAVGLPAREDQQPHGSRAAGRAPASWGSRRSSRSDRGLGAGRALGDAVLDWSRQEGHACVVTDWRATNLLSSRTWPALGLPADVPAASTGCSATDGVPGVRILDVPRHVLGRCRGYGSRVQHTWTYFFGYSPGASERVGH